MAGDDPSEHCVLSVSCDTVTWNLMIVAYVCMSGFVWATHHSPWWSWHLWVSADVIFSEVHSTLYLVSVPFSIDSEHLFPSGTENLPGRPCGTLQVIHCPREVISWIAKLDCLKFTWENGRENTAEQEQDSLLPPGLFLLCKTVAVMCFNCYCPVPNIKSVNYTWAGREPGWKKGPKPPVFMALLPWRSLQHDYVWPLGTE